MYLFELSLKEYTSTLSPVPEAVCVRRVPTALVLRAGTTKEREVGHLCACRAVGEVAVSCATRDLPGTWAGRDEQTCIIEGVGSIVV